MLAFTINSTRCRKLRGEVGHDSIAKGLARRCDLAGTARRDQDGWWKAVLKGRTHGRVARVADGAGQIAYLLSYLCWAWCFLGKEQPVLRTAPPELVYAPAKELETLKSTRQVSTQV